MTVSSTTRGFQPGARLGRYILGDRIGTGGMAEVYLARVISLAGFEKLFAIKVIHGHMVDDAGHAKMLLKEARIAATLTHPNIVQVLDVGVDGGEHYLAMEYIHGADLRRIMRRLGQHRPMPLQYALPIIHDVAQALHYAHTRRSETGEELGIVHRDVSLSNVLVSFSGGVKLTDFGIAKMSAHTSTTAAGTLKGKFGYMSPEQSVGDMIDARSDVFALGVVLYEMTTGRRAFPGENAFAIMNKVMAGEYVLPTQHLSGYPEALEKIVVRAMAIEPEDRYPTARAMADDLANFARDHAFALDYAALGDYVGNLFDWPSLPDVEATPIPELESATDLHTISLEGSLEPTSRRWAWGALALVAALGLGAYGGAMLGGDTKTAAAPGIDNPEPKAVFDPTPAVVAGDDSVDLDDAEVVVDDDADPQKDPDAEVEVDDGGAPSETVAVDATPEPQRNKRKKRKRKKKRRKKSSGTPPPDLRPPSLQGDP